MSQDVTRNFALLVTPVTDGMLYEWRKIVKHPDTFWKDVRKRE